MRFAKRAPTLFRRASAGVLNDMAFDAMRIAPKEIDKTMEVRNKSFVKSSFRVSKAKTGASISQQEAIMGSIFKPRFSGWREQETGKATERERIASLAARGGSKSSTIKPRFRMKKGRRFIKPQQFKGRNFPFKFRTMLRVLVSRRKRELFYMDRKYKGMRPGLYMFQRGKISKIQDATGDKAQPRRDRWMTRTNNRLKRTFDVRKSWASQLNRVLPKKI